jgi:ERCC4-type nuclease
MYIKIDYREHELLLEINLLINSNIHFKEIQIKPENLHLGDIIISNNSDEELLIIERKSINDLISSIKDGRYEEQSYRLSGVSHHKHNIIYLIEGDINKLHNFQENNKDKLIVYSAIFSLNYYKGFSVLRTLSIEETALFICNSINKMIKESIKGVKTPYYTSENKILNENNITEKSYINVVKKIKKDNITPNNIDEIMLSQIPGVSATISVIILKHYNSLHNLLNKLNEDEKCLHNFTYINAKNKTSKLNKICSENIAKFLLKK